LTNYLGNLLGFAISYYIKPNTIATFGIVGLLTAYNLVTSKYSVNSIALDDFNPQRIFYFCEEYIHNKIMLTPHEISKKEKMIFNKLKNISFTEHSLDFFINRERNAEYVVDLFEIFSDKRYFCYVKKFFSVSKLRMDYQIYMSLRVDADNNDLFLAYLFAIKLMNLLNNETKQKDIIKLIKENIIFIQNLEKKVMFEEIKLKGWSSNFSILEERYCRYHILYK
jgi:hypothetical protein